MSSVRSQNSQRPGQSSSQPTWNASEIPVALPTTKTENALRNVCKRNLKYEYLMKDLESRLSEDLSNFRTIDSLLQETFRGLQRNYQRAEKSLKGQVPQIREDQEDSMDSLAELADALPTIQTQVTDIQEVYDSGRRKARALVSDLVWLNTEFYERWRSIIFTSSSPVSWRWKVYMRSVFVISFIICSWLFWIAVTGAYRAHRHRLVWGEKLMS